MGELGNTATGLFSGVLKFVLNIVGVGLGIYGLVTGNWAAVGIGVGIFVLGQVVHALDQKSLDVQLSGWAAEAVAGVGPVPPRSVRTALMRFAAQSEGLGGDMKRGFQIACRNWAAEQEAVQ